MGEALTIYEVGLRDGLQNEKSPVPSSGKAHLLAALVRAGLRRIEATSFVSPRAVPQMSDASEVMALTRAWPEIRATALVINEKGYDRAREAGCDSVAIVVVVSETLCQRNNRMSVRGSIDACRTILGRAAKEGVQARVYIAPAWVCPFEGRIDPDHVIACADALWEMGPSELAIADTIGHAHPIEVGRLFERAAHRFGTERLAAHLHDTQAMALANAAAAIQAGVRTIDASIGGLGGCPFAPGAAGNLATEDIALMASKMGFDTGVDLEAAWSAVAVAEGVVGRALGGRSRGWWEASRRAHQTKEAKDANVTSDTRGEVDARA